MILCIFNLPYTILSTQYIFVHSLSIQSSFPLYMVYICAKGNHQRDGLDYNETFSSVIKAVTIRLAQLLATQTAWCQSSISTRNSMRWSVHGAATRFCWSWSSHTCVAGLKRQYMALNKPLELGTLSSKPILLPQVFRTSMPMIHSLFTLSETY